MNSERAQLIEELKQVFGFDNEGDLMNHLQNTGLVADEAVSLKDVPVCDLKRAHFVATL